MFSATRGHSRPGRETREVAEQPDKRRPLAAELHYFLLLLPELEIHFRFTQMVYFVRVAINLVLADKTETIEIRVQTVSFSCFLRKIAVTIFPLCL